MKRYLFRLSSFFLLLCAVDVHALTTNRAVDIQLESSSVLFQEEKNITFRVAGPQQILDVRWTNVSFARHSLELHLLSFDSNTFIMSMKNYEITNFIFPSLIVTTLSNKKTNSFYTVIFPMVVGTNFDKVPSPGPLMGIFAKRSWTWLWILGGVLLAAILVFLFFKIRKKVEDIVRKNRDPFEEFSTALVNLPINRLSEEEYRSYFELTSVSIRRLLEHTLNFPALESSSKEIRTHLQETKSEYQLQEIVKHILSLCDRVKYAKHAPGKEQLLTLLQENLSLMFSLSRQTGRAFDHILSEYQQHLKDLQKASFENTPWSDTSIKLRHIFNDFLTHFYFLEKTEDSDQDMMLVFQPFIPQKLHSDLDKIYRLLDSSQESDSRSRDRIIDTISEFFKNLSREYGYRETNIPLQNETKEEEA